MFRNFDNWDQYYDNERKLMRGCMQFMLQDGNTNAAIYDGDKVPLENPQLFDINGRTENQVFVDANVIAYVYKYIGEGNIADERQHGIDTSDQSKWALQYQVESLSIDERSVSGESAMGVGTMADLRDLDPSEVPGIYGKKIVALHGYYECGDKETVYYYWDELAQRNDDNGSCIQSNIALTGRWILVQPTEHCDSRHFGIFPQDSDNAPIDQSVNMTQFIGYCNTHSLHPYFNGSQSYPYFIYQNVAFNSRNTIDVSNDTIFVDKGSGNRFFGEWNGNPYFLNANTRVKAKTVRHSWHFEGYDASGTENYIVDSTWSPVLLSNINVVLETSPAANSQFTDCEMSSNEKITRAVVLQNMTVHTDWFADNYDWSLLSIYGCNIVLQNCKTANLYVMLKNKQNEADYGDLGEQTVSGATLLANCIAENGAFENVTLTGNTELHNISGTAVISGSAYNLNFIDCWLSFTNTTGVALSQIQWRRGSFFCAAQVQILSNLMLYDTDVNVPLYTPGAGVQMERCNLLQKITGQDMFLTSCKVNAPIEGKGVACKDCSINSYIVTTETGTRINFNFDDCYFGQNGIHIIESSTPNTSVVGAWTNNFAEAQHPIQINMANLIAADSGHPYTYEGNSGKFLKKFPVVSYIQGSFWTVNEVVKDIPGNDGPILAKPGLVLQPTHNEWFSGVWIPSRFSVSCPFFGIGLVTSRWRLTVTFEFTNDTVMDESMTPRVNHRMSVTADQMVNVSEAATYSCTEFNGKFIGGIFLGPNNFQYPAEITTVDPATWPQTNSAHVTIERLL